MIKPYPFAIEFGAEFGMFASYDSGSESHSYVVPTKSAAIGMVQSICRLKGASIEPCAIGVCYKPAWTPYAFNSFSPYRKNGQITGETYTQIRASVLVRPKFVILGLIHPSGVNVPGRSQVNHAHACQCQLARRVKRGQFFSPPVMGWKDFPVTDCTAPKTPIEPYNCFIPTFGYTTYPEGGGIKQNFLQNIEVKNGCLTYGSEEVEVKGGFLAFKSASLNKALESFVRIAR